LFLLLKAVVLSKAISSQLEKALALQSAGELDASQELFAKVLKSQVIIEKWRESDFEPLPFTPAEFQNFTRKDAKRWQEAVKISGFKAAE
jgi:tripartite-type tricarboxylate transporter receptor subunit TctC